MIRGYTGLSIAACSQAVGCSRKHRITHSVCSPSITLDSVLSFKKWVILSGIFTLFENQSEIKSVLIYLLVQCDNHFLTPVSHPDTLMQILEIFSKTIYTFQRIWLWHRLGCHDQAYVSADLAHFWCAKECVAHQKCATPAGTPLIRIEEGVDYTFDTPLQESQAGLTYVWLRLWLQFWHNVWLRLWLQFWQESQQPSTQAFSSHSLDSSWCRMSWRHRMRLPVCHSVTSWNFAPSRVSEKRTPGY